jgi:RNA polymerase sigma factor (sigma-70 family)
MVFNTEVTRIAETAKTVLTKMATIAPEIPVLARDEAFEKLYRRYVKDVYHYALALLRNPADAEDVTQTTFLNAYRAYQRGEEILKPQNWLIKIAHNVARSRYARISRRVKEVPLEDHVDQLAIPEDEKPNVEGVLRALGQLPFNQRAALVMRELEGRSYSEIADTLDVSVAAVETLIFRARRSLRVRTQALRSILAVPLPSTLASSLGGGGGAAAGGIGASFLIKAAVALVVGGLATGLGVEQSNRATAAPRDTVAPAVAAQGPASAGRHAAPSLEKTQRSSATTKTNAALTRKRSAPEDLARRGYTPTGVSRPATSDAQPQSSSAPSASPSSDPPAAATKTVQDAVATVEQTVASVTVSVPVSVPQVPPLPVQPPPLPPLP